MTGPDKKPRRKDKISLDSTVKRRRKRNSWLEETLLPPELRTSGVPLPTNHADLLQIYDAATERRSYISSVLFRACIAALRAKCTELENEKNATSERADKSSQKKDILRTERDTLKAEKAALKRERDALKLERDKLNGERDTLKDERDTLKDELARSKTDMGGSKADLDAATEEKAKLNQQLETLTTQLCTVTTERDSLAADLSRLQKKRGSEVLGHSARTPHNAETISTSTSPPSTEPAPTRETQDASDRAAMQRAQVSCAICMDVVAAPHLTSCGHSFCLHCLLLHLESSPAQPACPTCRRTVTQAPVRNWALEGAVEGVVENLPPSDRAEHRRRTKEAVQVLKNEDLWETYFPANQPSALIDYEDGVRRCGACAWEVVGGRCTGCNRLYLENGETQFSSDAEDIDSEADEDAGSDLGVETLFSGESDDEEGWEAVVEGFRQVGAEAERENEEEGPDEYDLDDPFVDDGPVLREEEGSEPDADAESEDEYVDSEDGSDQGVEGEEDDESNTRFSGGKGRKGKERVVQTPTARPRLNRKTPVLSSSSPVTSSPPVPPNKTGRQKRASTSVPIPVLFPSSEVPMPESEDDLVAAAVGWSSPSSATGGGEHLRRTRRTRKPRRAARVTDEDEDGDEGLDDLVLGVVDSSTAASRNPEAAVSVGVPRSGAGRRNKRRIESDDDEVVSAVAESPVGSSRQGRKRNKRMVVESDGEM
ncbi:hypothetical protein M427DRAFT_65403 [Gonapodya prolifera JEL478]|uniref:RING-type domain-containing protein n=1 Tax=Gonapodya prolifera (strain JEL478) TaxID=1344416 RepID=A0A139B0B8_GONPJ|nr:hypothetical protein M427DRAFT_65403 [Gonapodya prolifera JEL478]|eukprot:KXS22442.1 hypothetical protein M427DRAFT_65403 [Gonapodya prolifera JEL478]